MNTEMEKIPGPLAEAVKRDPTRFTPDVVKAIREVRFSVEPLIKEIIRARLEPREAIHYTQQVVGWENLLEADAKWLAEFREKMKTPEMQKVGRAFANTIAHTDFERGIETEGCCCPKCGSGPENLGWMCCGLAVYDASKEADLRHREVMAENKQKREEAKAREDGK